MSAEALFIKALNGAKASGCPWKENMNCDVVIHCLLHSIDKEPTAAAVCHSVQKAYKGSFRKGSRGMAHVSICVKLKWLCDLQQ